MNTQEIKLRTMVAVKLLADGHIRQDELMHLDETTQQNMRHLKNDAAILHSIESCEYAEIIEIIRSSDIDLSGSSISKICQSSSKQQTQLSDKVNAVLAEVQG